MAQDRSDMRIRGRGGSRPSLSRSLSRVSQRLRKGNGRKVLVVIVLFLVSIMASVIIVSLSMRLRTLGESSRFHSKVVRLGDVLPDTFAVEFRMFRYSNETTSIFNNTKENITINIQWERQVKCGFKYKEKRRESTDREEVLIVTDNEAVLQLTNNNKTTLSCFKHVENLGFFSMFRLIVNATKTDQFKPGIRCPGTLWSVHECNKEIFICEAHGTIISIHDEIRMARATSFSLNTSHINFFPNHNASCHFASSETFTSVKSGLYQYMNMSVRWRRSRKYCVFVHGIGVVTDSSSEDVGKLYWSNVRAYTPQCNDHRFILLDTVNYGWDSVQLHKKLCIDVAGQSKVIKDTVIFAHSIGNLVMAATLFKNICSFDVKSSEWYAIQAPWNGTKFADKLNELCKMNRSIHGYIAPEYLVQVLKELRYCTEDGNPVQAFKSLSPKYISSLNISFQDLIRVGKMYVTGALCGYSPWGMGKNWLQSSVMSLAQVLADLDFNNDGVVPEESCEIIGDFSNSYTSKFYRAKVNHIEGTYRYEESDWCKAWWEKYPGMPCRND